MLRCPRRWTFAVIVLTWLFHSSTAVSAPEAGLSIQQLAQSSIPDIQTTYAYSQYSLRPKSELSKLIFLIDLYRDSDVQVIYDGIENPSDVALSYARKYIGENYQKEKAENWIKKHAYRAKGSGQVIYVKFTDGSVIPLRDLLLEQLNRLAK